MEKVRKRREMMGKRRYKLLNCRLLKLFRNLMDFMKIIMKCGLIGMKLIIMNKNMMLLWPKKKSCLLLKMPINNKLMMLLKLN